VQAGASGAFDIDMEQVADVDGAVGGDVDAVECVLEDAAVGLAPADVATVDARWEVVQQAELFEMAVEDEAGHEGVADDAEFVTGGSELLEDIVRAGFDVGDIDQGAIPVPHQFIEELGGIGEPEFLTGEADDAEGVEFAAKEEGFHAIPVKGEPLVQIVSPPVGHPLLAGGPHAVGAASAALEELVTVDRAELDEGVAEVEEYGVKEIGGRRRIGHADDSAVVEDCGAFGRDEHETSRSVPA